MTRQGSSDRAPEMPVERLYNRLQEQLSPRDFDTWFRDTPCRLDSSDNSFVFTAENDFRRKWLEKHYGELCLAVARQVCSSSTRVRFELASCNASPLEAGVNPYREGGRELPPCTPDRFGGHGDELQERAAELERRGLTFEDFYVGSEANVAYAASQAVAAYPGKSYNPLYIHGEPGTGKTHLLQAISHRLATTSHLKQICVNGETFTNDYLKAVECRALDELQARYRQTDVLLVDDVHFLAGKLKTQEEFLHTFNSLLSNNRQVVLTSNSPPTETQSLHSALASRLRWGLSIQLERPSLETRIGMLLKKANRKGYELPAATAEYLAQNFPGNLRELQGALLRLISLGHVYGAPLSLDLARKSLNDTFRDEPAGVVHINSILHALQEYYGIEKKKLLSRSKARSYTFPRQMGMYLARELTPLSLQQIGLCFRRDHTTVLYGQNRIETLLRENPRVRKDFDALKARIKAFRSH